MPIHSADCSLVVAVQETADQYCAYEHHLIVTPGQPPEIIMVGSCKLTDVYRLIDGKTNSDWAGIFANGGSVMVRIIAVGDNKVDMRRFAATHARSLPKMPRCNQHGYNVRGITRRIICNNGIEYESQAKAAMELGISQSAISRHLRGELGSVNGFTFFYQGTKPTFTKPVAMMSPEPAPPAIGGQV